MNTRLRARDRSGSEKVEKRMSNEFERRDTVTSSTSEERQLVVFALGDESFGVDIESVREIIRWQPVTQVPDAPP